MYTLPCLSSSMYMGADMRMRSVKVSLSTFMAQTTAPKYAPVWITTTQWHRVKICPVDRSQGTVCPALIARTCSGLGLISMSLPLALTTNTWPRCLYLGAPTIVSRPSCVFAIAMEYPRTQQSIQVGCDVVVCNTTGFDSVKACMFLFFLCFYFTSMLQTLWSNVVT